MHGRVAAYRTRDGPPCVTPFIDRMELFDVIRERKLVVAGLIVARRPRPDHAAPRGPGACRCKWEFPGGKVEPGEAPVAALVRELREEIGVTVEVGRIWDVLFHAVPGVRPRDARLCVPDRRRASRAPSRSHDLAWVAPDELPAVGYPSGRPPPRRATACGRASLN